MGDENRAAGRGPGPLWSHQVGWDDLLRPGLLAAAARPGARFGEVAASSGCEPLARAQLLHLLWHRRLGTDLGQPLADRSLLVPGAAG